MASAMLSLTSSGGSNLFANAGDIEEDLAIVQPSRLVIDPTDVPAHDRLGHDDDDGLLFTADVVPFEVAFLPSPCSALEPLFLASRIVDVIFLMDIPRLLLPRRAATSGRRSARDAPLRDYQSLFERVVRPGHCRRPRLAA